MILGADRQKGLYWLANGLLAACCLLFIVLVLLNWLQTPELELNSERPPANTVMAQPLTWRWFTAGESSASSRQQVEVSEELSEASINARLIGVLISPVDAYATLSVSNQGERVFRLGDEIDNNVELIGIEPYRIIVSQGGRRLQVSMEKAGNQIRSSTAQSSADNNLPGNTGGAVEGFSLGDMVAAAPVEVEGYETGLKVDSISEEMRELAGLQEGDVVVDVGGNSIQALVSDPGQLTSLGADAQLPVTIIREGQEQVIYVDAPSLYSRMLPLVGQ